jgi:hypothetical protein
VVHCKIAGHKLRFGHFGVTFADSLMLFNSLLNFLVVNLLDILRLTQHNAFKFRAIKPIPARAKWNLLGLVKAGQDVGQLLFFFPKGEVNKLNTYTLPRFA